MNGSKSPLDTRIGESDRDEIRVTPRPRGESQRSASREHSTAPENPVVADETLKAAKDDDAASEAETLIDSPVKRREIEKQAKAAADRIPQHRIGGLPVPTDGDDDVESSGSLVTSTEKNEDVKDKDQDADADADGDVDGDAMDVDLPAQDASDPLSSPGASESRETSQSQSDSEPPARSRSPNPRKRKHRASSAGLPNKRQSVDSGRRNLRGLHSEELPARNGKSSSPKSRSHRRAVSTQSAIVDALGDMPNRKRRSATHGLGRDSKSSKGNWEESDESSETTSHDHIEAGKVLRRGIGRSTSTPGRPVGRERKRHVNRYGFTRLAEGCETGDVEEVMRWRSEDPDQLEIAEFAGNKPLQIAALNGNIEVVNYLIQQGCEIDCANQDKDTPLIDAAENGHLEVVESLLKAGVDPLRQNLKGRTALDVVKDETDDADDIRAALRQAIERWNSTGARQKREEEEEQRHRAGPTKELHFMARTYENLLRLVANNDRNGVREFLDARVPVDNGAIAAAAKTGDLYLVNMLLAEMPEKKTWSKAEKPMLAILGTSHFDMVKALTELEQFNPVWKDRKSRTWVEIAETRNGPMVREEKELLQKLYDEARRKERQSSSPVSRRDGGKRRPVQDASDEESEADVTPRRQKRRLMSRRDIRANGNGSKTKSEEDSEDDESSSEAVASAEPSHGRRAASMKPPESSPKAGRRQRTTSLSGQPPADVLGLRRRSSSLRGGIDGSLSTVEESSEAKAQEKSTMAQDDQAIEAAEAAEAAEQARKREMQRKQEEDAAAARRAAEEKAAEERAAKEEEKRREEQSRLERKLAEERQAQELQRQREQEEQRLAEKARLEEELRQQEQQAAELRAHQHDVLAGLPAPLAHMLNPESTFDYDDPETALTYLRWHILPIEIFMRDASDESLWMLNMQAAPLIGPHGLQLMYREGQAGYKGSLAETWDTREVETARLEQANMFLTEFMPWNPPPTREAPPKMTFEEKIEDFGEARAAVCQAQKCLESRKAALRYVRLDQVLANLCLPLKDVPISVKFLDFMPLPPAPGEEEIIEGCDFFRNVGRRAMREAHWLPRRYIGPKRIDNAHVPVVYKKSDVVWYHEK